MIRDRSKTAATSKVELFVIIVNGRKPLSIITKSSTLDVAAVLDPPLMSNGALKCICIMGHSSFQKQPPRGPTKDSSEGLLLSFTIQP